NALIALLAPDDDLHIAATSLENPVVAALDVLLGAPLLTRSMPRIGPCAAALASHETIVEEDGAAFPTLILPEQEPVLRATLARQAEVELGVVAPLGQSPWAAR